MGLHRARVFSAFWCVVRVDYHRREKLTPANRG
jgi:hypothetical protein